MEYEKHTFSLDKYDGYCILNMDFSPIEYIEIEKLFIEDEIAKSKAIVYKEYQDGYLTIINILMYHKNELEYIEKKTLTHSPQLLNKLMNKERDNKEKVDNLIKTLKMRGHTNISAKKEWKTVDYDTCEEALIVQIDSIFPISNEISFKEGREMIKKEGEFLKDYNPEIWGCFQFKNDIVFKRFRILFHDKNGKFIDGDF